MGILDCKGESSANGTDYTVRAVKLPPSGDRAERVEVTLTGIDADGAHNAAGTFVLPPDGLTAVGRLLNHIMTGLSTLNGRVPRPGAPPNANAPWTKEQDAELHARWLAAGDTNSVYKARRELATHFGRSTNSIRARLLHVGCDPDAPGRAASADPYGSPANSVTTSEHAAAGPVLGATDHPPTQTPEPSLPPPTSTPVPAAINVTAPPNPVTPLITTSSEST